MNILSNEVINKVLPTKVKVLKAENIMEETSNKVIKEWNIKDQDLCSAGGCGCRCRA